MISRLEVYTVKLPAWLKQELQRIRFNKNVKMAQVIYALIKTAEKYPDDFEHYLWKSRDLFRE